MQRESRKTRNKEHFRLTIDENNALGSDDVSATIWVKDHISQEWNDELTRSFSGENALDSCLNLYRSFKKTFRYMRSSFLQKVEMILIDSVFFKIVSYDPKTKTIEVEVVEGTYLEAAPAQIPETAKLDLPTLFNNDTYTTTTKKNNLVVFGEYVFFGGEEICNRSGSLVDDLDSARKLFPEHKIVSVEFVEVIQFNSPAVL